MMPVVGSKSTCPLKKLAKRTVALHYDATGIFASLKFVIRVPKFQDLSEGGGSTVPAEVAQL